MDKQINRTSVAAVVAATGHDWDEWNARLDAWGAIGREHKEVAAWLVAEQGVDGWWAQSITVAYERARGLRTAGSGRDGLFTVSVSKTVNVPVMRLYEAFLASQDSLRVRTSQPGKSARFDWADGTTRVNVGFDAKGPHKSTVAPAHERIADAAQAEKFRALWRERLSALKTGLEA